MNKKIEVQHKGVTIRISSYKSVKKGSVYKCFQIADYSSGKRKRLTFSDLEEAKKEARKLADCTASGQGSLFALAPIQQEIQSAMAALAPTATRLDRAAYIFADACKVVEPDEIVEACKYWRKNAPNTRLRLVTIADGVKGFTSQHRASVIRMASVRNFLNIFVRGFGSKQISEIEQIEIEKWFSDHQWGAKTTNDYLQIISQFWKYALKSGWASKNPVSEIRRMKAVHNPVTLYTPEALRTQLYNLTQVAPELVAAAALGAFGGLRISEIGRTDWSQLNEAIQTGFLELCGRQTKTGETRNVPLTDNLKAWLLTCRKQSGPVLPSHWLTPTKRHQDRLNELGRHIARKTKVKWQSNGWRHSFGTFHLKLHGDPHSTITAMGTSLAKLNKNYMSKSQIVSKEMAAAYFTILPPATAQNVIPMPLPETMVLSIASPVE